MIICRVLVIAALVLVARALSVAEVQAGVARILARHAATENWAVSASVLRNASSPTPTFAPLVSARAAALLVPASNTKLLAASALWWTQRQRERFRTRLALHGTTLRVLAAGDPSLVSNQLRAALRSVRAASVQVALDGAADDGNATPGSWEAGDLLFAYGAQPTALLLDQVKCSFVVAPMRNVVVVEEDAAMQMLWKRMKLTSTHFFNSTYFFHMKNTIVLNVRGGSKTGDAVTLEFSDAEMQQAMGGLVNTDAVRTDDKCSEGLAPLLLPSYGGDLALSGCVHPGSLVSTTLACPRPQWRAARYIAALVGATSVVLNDTVPSTPVGMSNSIVSEPFDTLLNYTLHVSNNLFAERLFQAAGGHDGVLKSLPKSVVDNIGTYADGSGLSRHNLIAPAAFDNLMQAHWMRQSKQNSFFPLLPQAGRSGTLKHRFVGTPAEGITFAKTGTMSGVNALSGVILRQPVVTFSIIANNSPRSSHEVRPEIDEIVNLFAQLEL